MVWFAGASLVRQHQQLTTTKLSVAIPKHLSQQAQRSLVSRYQASCFSAEMLSSFAPVKPCPACTVRPSNTFRPSRKRPRAAYAEQHSQPADSSGNPDVQEKLMDIIRVQIGQEKVKDFVKDEGEKLRQAAEEVSIYCETGRRLKY